MRVFEEKLAAVPCLGYALLLGAALMIMVCSFLWSPDVVVMIVVGVALGAVGAFMAAASFAVEVSDDDLRVTIGPITLLRKPLRNLRHVHWDTLTPPGSVTSRGWRVVDPSWRVLSLSPSKPLRLDFDDGGRLIITARFVEDLHEELCARCHR